MNKKEWILKAGNAGMEGFEIRETTTTSRELSWFEGKVDSFVTSKQKYTSLRALIDGKIVSISLEKVDDDDMESVFGTLKEQAAFVSETEKDQLNPQMRCDETLSLHTWIRPTMDQVEDVLASLENKLAEAQYVSQVNELQWEDASSSSQMQNSLGLKVQDQSEYQLIMAQITMTKDGEVRDGYEIEVVHDLAAFDQDAFVKKLTEKVAGQLGASSVKSRTCPVIFDNKAMTTLFGCFVPAFYGSLISKGISPLCGKLGEQIFSPLVTVIDNPRQQDAISLQNYDDEGHPTYEKIVVNKGVFSTILHNTKSALKMDAESTGNGFGKGGGATDVSAMNIYIVPGKNSPEALEEQIRNGVVITDLAGMHAGVDFISGNFSLQAKGFLVENGKRTRPLTLITIAGNYFELMKKVTALGNDLDWSYHSMACPSIAFEEAAITGKE